MKRVSLGDLQIKTQSFLEKYFPKEVAQDCAEVILYAELRNKNGQGLLKLMGTEPLQNVIADKPIDFNHRTPLSALISGNKNPSFHIAQTATRLCIEKAKTHGFGIVGANGIYSSTGALGFYAEKVAQEGLIAFCCARSPGSMAPFGLSVPLFGTNPFAWAFPTAKQPVVFDMATSAITFYELVLAKLRGEKIPADVAVNKLGQLTDDPAEAMDGGILPFDKGYKGSSLSMMVEVFSGPLVNASYCDYETFDKDWGFLIFAIDPNLLVDKESFIRESSDIVNIIHSHGAKVPGDNGRDFEKKLKEQGFFELDDEIAELIEI